MAWRACSLPSAPSTACSKASRVSSVLRVKAATKIACLPGKSRKRYGWVTPTRLAIASVRAHGRHGRRHLAQTGLPQAAPLSWTEPTRGPRHGRVLRPSSRRMWADRLPAAPRARAPTDGGCGLSAHVLPVGPLRTGRRPGTHGYFTDQLPLAVDQPVIRSLQRCPRVLIPVAADVTAVRVAVAPDSPAPPEGGRPRSPPPGGPVKPLAGHPGDAEPYDRAPLSLSAGLRVRSSLPHGR